MCASPRRRSSRSGWAGNSKAFSSEVETGSRQENASSQEESKSPRNANAISGRGRESIVSADPLRVACIGIGWWSDVLADAMQRSGKLEIVSGYTRSGEKMEKFA